MPTFLEGVHHSPSMVALSGQLTNLVNNFDLSRERNVVVYAFSPDDNPDWHTLPPVWRTYEGNAICLNYGKLMEAVNTPASMIPSTVASIESHLAYIRGSHGRRQHFAYQYGKVNPRPVEFTHRNIADIATDFRARGRSAPLTNLAAGAVVREAGYAVFTDQIINTSWYQNLTGYQRNIIGVLEELRVEAQQIKRIHGASVGAIRNLFRVCLPVTASTRQVIADMTATVASGENSGISIAKFGLNASLILGRAVYGILADWEVAALRDQVETYVGDDRLKSMEEIWREYSAITDATESNIMPLVHRWEELFPSAEDGSNAGSSTAPAPPTRREASAADPGSGEGEGESGDDSGEGKGAGKGKGEGDDSDEGTSGEGKGEGDSGSDTSSAASGDSNGEGDPSSSESVSSGTTSSSTTPGTVQHQNKNAADMETVEWDGDSSSQGTRGAVGQAFTETTESIDYEKLNTDNDPGTEEVLELQGVAEELQRAAGTPDLGDTEMHDYDPRQITPSRVSHSNAKHRYPAVGATSRADALETGREIEPNRLDRDLAQQFMRELETLNAYDRGKFTVPQLAPPGRMRSRAAVQQAAERSLKLPRTARPWERTVRTVDVNPPLTVGIMSDVSGSMGWAEQLTARLAWVMQHAVSRINGNVACLSFGAGVTVTLRPGERMERAQVVSADNAREEFDMACGTADVMLNLLNGTGTRLLIVITDGYFVAPGMRSRAKQWVELLNSRGVHVVWVTPENPDSATTPQGAIYVPATDLRFTDNKERKNREMQKLMSKLAAEVKRAVQDSKYGG